VARDAGRTDGIEWTSWEAETHDLQVAFTSGNVYRFQGVPKRFHTELLKHKDQRKFVRTQLMGRYDYARVEAS
jgi:hypothetical protein